jgi:hypothetical protein
VTCTAAPSPSVPVPLLSSCHHCTPSPQSGFCLPSAARSLGGGAVGGLEGQHSSGDPRMHGRSTSLPGLCRGGCPALACRRIASCGGPTTARHRRCGTGPRILWRNRDVRANLGSESFEVAGSLLGPGLRRGQRRVEFQCTQLVTKLQMEKNRDLWYCSDGCKWNSEIVKMQQHKDEYCGLE